MTGRAAVTTWLAVTLAACGGARDDDRIEITISGSALGDEGAVLRRQVRRFEARRPDVRVRILETPDAADERRQLYVQWLNARVADPDVLQLDVIWVPEFAAAGWLRPLEGDVPAFDDAFPAMRRAARWDGRPYAAPWIIDVGMLYWRTDLIHRPPRTFDELVTMAAAARRARGLPYGFVWQGARYEGLVTVFLEVLGGFGGALLADTDPRADDARIVVDAPAGVRALRWMRAAIHRWDVSPEVVLTWQEERARLAFQRGDAVFMRNWPYAWRLLSNPETSRVAGRFAVAPMPAAPGGRPTATLGGQLLALNARTEHPEAARALVDFLTAPAQMLERARATGQLPARASLYDDPALAAAATVPPAQARAVIEQAVPRPPTPVYPALSRALQVHLHRALTGQAAPAVALERAAGDMRQALAELDAAPRGAAAPVAGALIAAAAALALLGALAARRIVADWRREPEARVAWALVLPAVAVVAAVALFPLGWAAWESLHLHDLRAPWRGRPFVGLAQYVAAAGDERFHAALAHTAVFTGVSVAAEVLLGLVLAVALDRSFRGRGLARAVALVPWALPTVVAALVWRFMFEGPAGIANAALAGLGVIEEPIVWFGRATASWVPVVLADVWKTTPFVALLLLAGLQTIDDTLYEAARVDGAGPAARFAHVTLPLLRPALAVVLLFRTLDAFRVFGLIYVLTGGGPGTATEPVALYTFDVLLRELRFGYGSALSVLVFVAALLIALFFVGVIGAGRAERT